MEISERKKRGRPRKFARDESAQPSAFPLIDGPAEAINDDAEEKRKVAEAAKHIPEIFSPSDVIWCFDVYVALLCFLYSMALKVPFDALENELSFSQDQKELMAVPLSKICSKYAPAEWAAKKDEIQLIVMLGVYTASSVQRARNVAKQIAEEKKRNEEKTVPLDPMRRVAPMREAHVPA